MSSSASVVKRVVLGRPFRSDRMGHTLLPKWIALPVFASDPLSSVAYATQEILLILTLGGVAYLHLAPWIAAAVVVLLAVVVLSYRQVVRAYPSGGGSYEVVAKNVGPRAGLVVAAALLVDYVMTVAVSVAAGVDNVISAIPELNAHRVAVNVAFVVVLTAMNLRGVRESGRAFAVPTYAFVVGVMAMIALGLTRAVLGDVPQAESAHYGIHAETVGLSTLALAVLMLRAFSSGCTALTGVEAISNGVPAFRKPKSLNAARTMSAMGALAIAMFVGVTALAMITGTRVVENTCDLIGFRGDCTRDPQRTVIAQISAAVFGNDSVMFFYLQAATALILILAANTAFNGFPLLSSILAQDRYLPRQLHTRGDRLAFSNGVVLLAVIAGGLIVAFDGSTTHLIQLYIVGVFTSFTLCQVGMVRHWNRELAESTTPAQRRRIRIGRAINAFGAALTGVVLAVVMVTKFTHGAYLVVIAIPVLCVLMPDPSALRSGQGRAARRARRRRCPPESGACHRARLQLAQGDAARTTVRPRDPPRHLDRADGEHRQRRHPRTARRVGDFGRRSPLEGPGISVPGNHPAGRGLHQTSPGQWPPRRHQRLHPRIRGRPLVGERATQSELAAAEGPITVRTGRHGHQRALATTLHRPP